MPTAVISGLSICFLLTWLEAVLGFCVGWLLDAFFVFQM
jgi:hypothetical protein